MEGSCVCWATGYYTKTFQEAKEHDWNVSAATWSGGHYGAPSASYQDRIMSPDFLYHQINDGVDKGSYYSSAMDVCNIIGISSWKQTPNSCTDYTTWPKEAAWREAPLYRSDTGYGYLWLYPPYNSNGTNALKAWLDSGHLSVISVDANQYNTLSANDLWINGTYTGGTTNHANTVVGYDDNFGPYTENGTSRRGAFKVANSWLTGWTGDHNSDGFYWISYECMKWEVYYTFMSDDKIGYQPQLLSVFNITHNKRGECDITIGIGDKSSPIWSKRFDDWYNDWCGGNHPYPNNRMVLDITEFKDNVTSYYGNKYFIKVYDYKTGTTGTITEFSVEHYVRYPWPKPAGNASSKDPPVATTNLGNAYAQLTLNPYAYNVDTEKYYGTLQGAIDAPATLNGHHINASAGYFNEDVTVNKRVNITGWGPGISVINGTRAGDTVRVTAASANLTGLSIRNSGTGVADAGLELSGVSMFNITNCSLATNPNKDMRLLGSNAWTLNTTFNNASVSLDPSSFLKARWFLHVLVKNITGKPIASAEVKVEDNANGTWQRTVYTNAQGRADWIVVTEFTQAGTSRTYYSPYKVTVKNATLDPTRFNNDPRTVFTYQSRTETFYGIPEFELIMVPAAAMTLFVLFTVARKRLRGGANRIQ